MPKTKIMSLSFCFILFLSTIINTSVVSASEWYENGSLYFAIFQQWKTATHSNKLATCAVFILAAVNDGYFLLDNKDTLLNAQNTELLKNLAEILVNTNDAFINNSTHLNDPVNGAALLSMLALEWIKPDYLAFLASSTHKTYSSRFNETSHIQDNHKENSNKKNSSVNNSKTQIVKVKRHRLMSPTEGRKWVKKNIILGMTFIEEELVDRFGQYEKNTDRLRNNKTLTTLTKYYFKHINLTFFVMQENQTIIVFSDGKGFME